MAGLFGDVRGNDPIGLFGRQRRITDEEQRRLAELASLAGELGFSPQSQSLPAGALPEPLGQSLVPTAQLHSLPQDAFPGGGRAPSEPRSNGFPFPPGGAGDLQMLGAQGAAGGSLERSAIGGLRAEAEGYADQIAQRGTPQWGSAVRGFVMQGPVGSGNLGFHSDEDLAGSGLGSAAEKDGFGRGPTATQTRGFGQAEAEAESLRPAALFWEGEDSPRQFMRPAAFQDGFDRTQDRAIAQKQAKRTRGNAGGIYGTLRGFPREEPEQRLSPVPVRATQAQLGIAPGLLEPRKQVPPQRPQASAMPNPNTQRVLTPRELLKSRIRAAESSGNDRAVSRNPKSSAAGRYGFTNANWAEMHREIYGGDGLADKFNPEKQERVMDARLDRYEATLRRAKFEPTARNLYLVHFAGPTGAIRLLRNPDKPVEALLSRDAVQGNPQIQGMSAAEVIEYANRKMNGDPPKGQPSRGRTPARVPRK